MPQIGEFTRQKSGFSGRIQTLTLDFEIAIVAVDTAGVENAPDHRVHLGSDDTGPEVGAGWSRTGEKAGEYVSLQLDDPTFAQPIRANLFQSADDKSAWGLYWNRPIKRSERD